MFFIKAWFGQSSLLQWKQAVGLMDRAIKP